MTGGVIAAVSAWLLGPRIGKYNQDGAVGWPMCGVKRLDMTLC
jgi:gas vesicle protein